MNRQDVARAVGVTVELYQWLLAEAERELSQTRNLADKYLNALVDRADEIVRLRSELADYERTVARLREQLREEEARRASYQTVHAHAVRFIRGCDWRPAGGKAEITAPDDDHWQALMDAARHSA